MANLVERLRLLSDIHKKRVDSAKITAENMKKTIEAAKAAIKK